MTDDRKALLDAKGDSINNAVSGVKGAMNLGLTVADSISNSKASEHATFMSLGEIQKAKEQSMTDYGFEIRKRSQERIAFRNKLMNDERLMKIDEMQLAMQNALQSHNREKMAMVNSIKALSEDREHGLSMLQMVKQSHSGEASKSMRIQPQVSQRNTLR